MSAALDEFMESATAKPGTYWIVARDARHVPEVSADVGVWLAARDLRVRRDRADRFLVALPAQGTARIQIVNGSGSTRAVVGASVDGAWTAGPLDSYAVPAELALRAHIRRGWLL